MLIKQIGNHHKYCECLNFFGHNAKTAVDTKNTCNFTNALHWLVDKNKHMHRFKYFDTKNILTILGFSETINIHLQFTFSYEWQCCLNNKKINQNAGFQVEKTALRATTISTFLRRKVFTSGVWWLALWISWLKISHWYQID